MLLTKHCQAYFHKLQEMCEQNAKTQLSDSIGLYALFKFHGNFKKITKTRPCMLIYI